MPAGPGDLEGLVRTPSDAAPSHDEGAAALDADAGAANASPSRQGTGVIDEPERQSSLAAPFRGVAGIARGGRSSRPRRAANVTSGVCDGTGSSGDEADLAGAPSEGAGGVEVASRAIRSRAAR